MGARRALIALQREVLAGIEAEVNAVAGREPPSLRRYAAEYERAFRDYRRLVSREELVAQVIQSDIVYCADFHTLRQAQRTCLRILRGVLDRRPVVLALEMVMARHQKALDAYLAGQLGDLEFLEAIDYARTWGFDWNHYRPLLELARENRLPVVALNSRPAAERVGMAARDRFAARIIARLTVERPDAIVFVVFGELHLSEGHLPARVEEQLARHGVRRRRTVIHQNSTALYWKLTARGLEHRADVLELKRGVYCVMNTAPWVKLQSYLHWHRKAPVLTSKLLNTEIDDADPEDVIPYDDEVCHLARIVARFLGVEEPDLGDVSVYTLDDLSFLERLRRDERYGLLRRLVRQRESFFLPDLRLLYLSSLSVNRAAEEAGIYLLYRCSDLYPPLGSGKEAFYARVYARALGYLASKLVNHKRKCPRLKDHERVLHRLGRRRKLTAEDALARAVARAVVRHQERMARLGRRRRLHLPAVYRADPPSALRISRAIGMLYGDSLFTALIQGRVTREQVRRAFHAGREPGFDPFEAVREIHRQTEGVEAQFESKDDYF